MDEQIQFDSHGVKTISTDSSIQAKGKRKTVDLLEVLAQALRANPKLEEAQMTILRMQSSRMSSETEYSANDEKRKKRDDARKQVTYYLEQLRTDTSLSEEERMEMLTEKAKLNKFLKDTN